MWFWLCRHLLCEVVRVKVESEEMMRGRANGEETLMVNCSSLYLEENTKFLLFLGIFGC